MMRRAGELRRPMHLYVDRACLWALRAVLRAVRANSDIVNPIVIKVETLQARAQIAKGRRGGRREIANRRQRRRLAR